MAKLGNRARAEEKLASRMWTEMVVNHWQSSVNHIWSGTTCITLEEAKAATQAVGWPQPEDIQQLEAAWYNNNKILQHATKHATTPDDFAQLFVRKMFATLNGFTVDGNILAAHKNLWQAYLAPGGITPAADFVAALSALPNPPSFSYDGKKLETLLIDAAGQIAPRSGSWGPLRFSFSEAAIKVKQQIQTKCTASGEAFYDCIVSDSITLDGQPSSNANPMWIAESFRGSRQGGSLFEFQLGDEKNEDDRSREYVKSVLEALAYQVAGVFNFNVQEFHRCSTIYASMHKLFPILNAAMIVCSCSHL